MNATFWLRISWTLSIVLIGLPPLLRAQTSVPIGTWRTHFSYHQVNHLAVTPERVYAAAANGLFSVSRTDGSVRILSKNDGFSDVSVVALAYEPASGTLLLAYRSGRIDLLMEGNIRTFDLLQRATEQEPEVIYDIHWQGSTALISTSQGVRVLTLTERGLQIAASYTRLSATGDPLPIYSATTSGDSIFLATDEGVIANALAATTNRQDFRTWRRLPSPVATLRRDVRHVAYQDGTLYAAYDGVGLFQRSTGRWRATELTTSRPFRALRATATSLVAVTDEQVVTLDGSSIVSNVAGLAPQDAEVDEQGTVWIADRKQGLLRFSDGAFVSFLPNGPASDDLPVVRWAHDRLLALDASSDGRFSDFREGEWTVYEVPPPGAQIRDVAFDPNARNYYLALFGQGLLRWDGQQEFLTVSPPGDQVGQEKFTALAYQEGRLWVGQSGDTTSLLSFSPDESAWQTVTNPTLQAVYPQRLSADFSGSLWMVAGNTDDSSGPGTDGSGTDVPGTDVPGTDVPGTDVLVFNPLTDEVQSIVTTPSATDLPGRLITDLVVDRNGLVWIGGNQGIAYFPNPGRVFSDVLLVRPVFERQFLLRDEYVTCLAVDGGNRKWVGTRNGLWLFSETGEELIHRFTQENSPLISDAILDVAVNPLDGEVFVATDRGLVSYRGGATEGSVTHQSVEVFPNPVPSNFGGTVGIRGLAQDATVKITTVSGALVRELQAQGGTATWDGRNRAGQAVSTGVYLLFSATANGEETYVGKLAVIP